MSSRMYTVCTYKTEMAARNFAFQFSTFLTFSLSDFLVYSLTLPSETPELNGSGLPILKHTNPALADASAFLAQAPQQPIARALVKSIPTTFG